MQNVEIHIRGKISQDWEDWFGGLKITHQTDGCTVLRGSVRDQSALYGLLSQLSNLGVQLISVSSESENNNGQGKEVKI